MEGSVGIATDKTRNRAGGVFFDDLAGDRGGAVHCTYRAHRNRAVAKTDDETGNPVSWFLFVERGGFYEGVIAKLFLRPQDPKNQICSSCRDDRKDQPLLGLPLVRNMQRDGLTYQGGNIL